MIVENARGNWFQRAVKRLAGDYKVFVILSQELATKAGAAPADVELGIVATPEMASTGGYAGPDSYGVAWTEGGRALCTCWVWYGGRYRTRNFWPLDSNECKLIALETKEEARGRGIAPKVIEFTSSVMARNGFARMFARVWHSNRASLRAFEKAGWARHALVVEIYPAKWKLRWVIPLRLESVKDAQLSLRRRGAPDKPAG